MTLEFETTSGVQWEPGPYEGHLTKIEKRFKQFRNEEDGTVENRDFLIWYFGIDEEGFENVTLTAVSSNSWGPKSKARAWANAILRRELEDGEKFTADDLYNKPVIINVVLKNKSNGTFAEVESLAPVRKKTKVPA
jgi:hypothetical protein